MPPPHSDTVEFYQRLSTETLFFIFYYLEVQQGPPSGCRSEVGAPLRLPGPQLPRCPSPSLPPLQQEGQGWPVQGNSREPACPGARGHVLRPPWGPPRSCPPCYPSESSVTSALSHPWESL